MANPSASYASMLGWSVGIFSWLDSTANPANRYWRTIEFGSESQRSSWPWQGQTIVGVWSSGSGGRVTPFVRGRGDQDFIPLFRSISDSEEDLAHAGRKALALITRGGTDLSMFTPRGEGDPDAERKRFYFWLMTQATLRQMPFVGGVVRKPVEAKSAYSRAIAAFDPVRAEMEALKFELDAWGESRSTIRGTIGHENAGGSRSGRRRVERQHVDYVAPSSGAAIPFAAAARSMPLISVTASAEVQDLMRDGRGRFSAGVFQDIIRRVNAKVAKRFQDEVVRQIEQTYARPSKGTLAKAHADERNRFPR